MTLHQIYPSPTMTNSQKTNESGEPKRRGRPKGSTNKLPRLSRVKASDRPGMVLTDRDVGILRAVYEYRALSTAQIQALLFTTTTDQQCRYRLKLLFQNGYLFRNEQLHTLSEERKPLVYWLDKKGAEVIAEREGITVGDLDWNRQERNVRYLFLEHLLTTNEVRIAFTLAAQRAGYLLDTWSDERALRRSHKEDEVLIVGEGGERIATKLFPDGYFVLDTPQRKYRHFLEIDRTTETVTGKWAQKIAAYNVYFAPMGSGESLYQRRYGVNAGRVIVVTTSAKRLAHLKAETQKEGGKARFWFTTFDQLTATTALTEKIWQVASREDTYAFIW